MGRLRALVLQAQQIDATRDATAQQKVLHVAPPRECNTQQPEFEAPSAAELRALIEKLAKETGYFTEADKLEALEVALRDPGAWVEYLPLLLASQNETKH